MKLIEKVRQEIGRRIKKNGKRRSLRFSESEERLLVKCQKLKKTNVTDTLIHGLITLHQELTDGTE